MWVISRFSLDQQNTPSVSQTEKQPMSRSITLRVRSPNIQTRSHNHQVPHQVIDEFGSTSLQRAWRFDSLPSCTVLKLNQPDELCR